MAEHVYSLEEIPDHIEQLPDQFEHDPTPVTVMHNGKESMIILPTLLYRRMQQVIAELHYTVEAYQETFEVTSDPELMAAIREGMKDIEEGRGESLDDVLKESGWEE